MSSEHVTFELVTTVDVLSSLVKKRSGSTPLIVGFAAETADNHDHLLELGKSKLSRKGCDLLVVNEVGSQEVFGSPENCVTILASDGSAIQIERSSKASVADALWDLVAPRVSVINR